MSDNTCREGVNMETKRKTPQEIIDEFIKNSHPSRRIQNTYEVVDIMDSSGKVVGKRVIKEKHGGEQVVVDLLNED